ncbi:stalk domain-containing protein [Ferviditalea candida]|uniref:Copper amine oxidase N-terminal domain-containing protein n=1 Tax=Ferviditalea candida TaxID=3108399 RepID=A0ABU5ZG84_9BACL|nr:copper amine oxidase N-terminal domain-containing protein [Paenibacillaceae bacterium T2]
MKHAMLKAIAFFLMFVLVFSYSAYKSSYVLADRNEHEYEAEHYEYHKAKEHYEDEDQYGDEDQDDSEEHHQTPSQQAADQQNQNPAVNQNSPATVTPAPVPAQTPEPPAAVKFVDGQTVHLKISGLDKPLTLTLRVHKGEIRVAAEKVLHSLDIPYLAYQDGALLEVYTADHHLIFHTGKNVYYDNGQKRSIPIAPQSENGYFYVPLTLLAERLGYTLEWNPQNQTFRMMKGGK